MYTGFCKKSSLGMRFASPIHNDVYQYRIGKEEWSPGEYQAYCQFQERTAPHLGSERRSSCTGLFC